MHVCMNIYSDILFKVVYLIILFEFRIRQAKSHIQITLHQIQFSFFVHSIKYFYGILIKDIAFVAMLILHCNSLLRLRSSVRKLMLKLAIKCYLKSVYASYLNFCFIIMLKIFYFNSFI